MYERKKESLVNPNNDYNKSTKTDEGKRRSEFNVRIKVKRGFLLLQVATNKLQGDVYSRTRKKW